MRHCFRKAVPRIILFFSEFSGGTYLMHWEPFIGYFLSHILPMKLLLYSQRTLLSGGKIHSVGSRFYDILGDVIKGTVSNLSFTEQFQLVQRKGSDLIPCLLGFLLYNQWRLKRVRRHSMILSLLLCSHFQIYGLKCKRINSLCPEGLMRGVYRWSPKSSSCGGCTGWALLCKN